jgi:hypothetical protein
VFELRETLMGKYGEDSKLIYDLADQVRPFALWSLHFVCPAISISGAANLMMRCVGGVAVVGDVASLVSWQAHLALWCSYTHCQPATSAPIRADPPCATAFVHACRAGSC